MTLSRSSVGPFLSVSTGTTSNAVLLHHLALKVNDTENSGSVQFFVTRIESEEPQSSTVISMHSSIANLSEGARCGSPFNGPGISYKSR